MGVNLRPEIAQFVHAAVAVNQCFHIVVSNVGERNRHQVAKGSEAVAVDRRSQLPCRAIAGGDHGVGGEEPQGRDAAGVTADQFDRADIDNQGDVDLRDVWSFQRRFGS